MGSFAAISVLVLGLVLNAAVLCNGGKTSRFVRKLEKTEDMPLDTDVFRVPHGYNAPQQVHITQGDHEGKGVIVSWVTPDEPGSNTVVYWKEDTKDKKKAEGKVYTYKTETPWLIVLMHSPWYNSYNYHYMEGESMRVMFEKWFVKYKVDVVFAGHVHAYERSERVSNIAYNISNGICVPVKDQSAPVYITIGDGGNLEGLATNMTEPQPAYSAYREASFGHAMFSIKNRTHAYYSWHRNQDGYAVEADSMWFFNRFWHPIDESPESV
ncbi:hypothetical protein SLEP1_g31111 [Rubroshorea leprosula]|uniref:Purple acid phosphatase n=1 Tax=Rubroshorea leprosula TaxID=152421 RepID=A0AAV5KA11_9ROSI|nr:hypothetical protein SLEP1_g31111 [Rubroshorea leprosula]